MIQICNNHDKSKLPINSAIYHGNVDFLNAIQRQVEDASKDDESKTVKINFNIFLVASVLR